MVLNKAGVDLVSMKSWSCLPQPLHILGALVILPADILRLVNTPHYYSLGIPPRRTSQMARYCFGSSLLLVFVVAVAELLESALMLGFLHRVLHIDDAIFLQPEEIQSVACRAGRGVVERGSLALPFKQHK